MKYTVIFLVSIFTLASCTMDKSSQIQDIKSDMNTGVISSTTFIPSTDITIYPLIVSGNTKIISGASLSLEISNNFQIIDCERAFGKDCLKYQGMISSQEKKFITLSSQHIVSGEIGYMNWCYHLLNEITITGSFASGSTKFGMGVGIPLPEVGEIGELPMSMWWRSTNTDYIQYILRDITHSEHYLRDGNYDAWGVIPSDLSTGSGIVSFTTMGSVRPGNIAHTYITSDGCVKGKIGIDRHVIIPLDKISIPRELDGLQLRIQNDSSFLPNPTITIHKVSGDIHIPLQDTILSDRARDVFTYEYQSEHSWMILHLSSEMLRDALSVEIISGLK